MRMKARFVDKNGKHVRGFLLLILLGECRLNLDDLMHIFGVRVFQAWLFICSMQHLSLDRTKTSSHSPWKKGFPSTIYNSWLMAPWTMDSHGHRSGRSIVIQYFQAERSSGGPRKLRKRAAGWSAPRCVRLFVGSRLLHPWRLTWNISMEVWKIIFGF